MTICTFIRIGFYPEILTFYFQNFPDKNAKFPDKMQVTDTYRFIFKWLKYKVNYES